MAGTTITARTVAEDELDEWDRIESAAFGTLPRSDARRALERRLVPLDRVIGAFDGAALVGAAASYGMDMTVPGGGTIPVAGVTAVGVAGTHRRRGALRAMMDFQLDDTVARGEVAAVLNASESNIYGRFGYGLAQQYQRLAIRTQRAEYDRHRPRCPSNSYRRRRPPTDCARSSMRTARPAPVRCRGPDAWWDGVLGDIETWKGGGKIFVVIAEGRATIPVAMSSTNWYPANRDRSNE